MNDRSQRGHRRALDEATEQRLWQQVQEGNPDARNTLIEQYLPLVRYVVGRMNLAPSGAIGYDDLVSYGTFGLLDAINRFEPERGFKFMTYAIQRIQGSILDELRHMDWAPRRIRSKVRKVDIAREKLHTTLGREPTDNELAQHMGLPPKEVSRRRQDASQTSLNSLDAPLDAEGLTYKQTIKDRQDVEEHAGMAHNRKAIAKALKSLPVNYCFVIAMHYFLAMNFAQMSTVLGVTKSRVGQLHADAMRELRKAVAL